MKHDHKAIRELAFRLWEARGRPSGSAEADWLEAERRVAAAEPAAASPSSSALDSAALDEALKDSFPASDPPAGGLPDNPPANAEEKWQAAAASKIANGRAKDPNRARNPTRRPKSTPQTPSSPGR